MTGTPAHQPFVPDDSTLDEFTPRAVVMGVPARVVREVPEGDLIAAWRS